MHDICLMKYLYALHTCVRELHLDVTYRKNGNCLTTLNKNISLQYQRSSKRKEYHFKNLTTKCCTSTNFGFIRASMYFESQASRLYTNFSYVNHQEQLEVYISSQQCVLSSCHPIRSKHLKYQVQKLQKTPSSIL